MVQCRNATSIDEILDKNNFGINVFPSKINFVVQFSDQNTDVTFLPERSQLLQDWRRYGNRLRSIALGVFANPTNILYIYNYTSPIYNAGLVIIYILYSEMLMSRYRNEPRGITVENNSESLENLP